MGNNNTIIIPIDNSNSNSNSNENTNENKAEINLLGGVGIGIIIISKLQFTFKLYHLILGVFFGSDKLLKYTFRYRFVLTLEI